MSDKELNLRVAETLWKEHRWSGQTFNDGDYVAFLDGNIIAVTDNSDDAIAALRAVDPNPHRGMVVDVSPPEVDVIRGEASIEGNDFLAQRQGLGVDSGRVHQTWRRFAVVEAAR